ncbi:MAG TPA: hypothetical protein PKC91_08730 [Ignavibacteria bacterium]|nr:hypothetical protein [Ignavibacteria bacterium]
MEETLQITQIITNIIIILFFLGLTILVFGLIKQAKKITGKIDDFSKDFSDIKPKVVESFEKINSLSDNVNGVVSKVNENVDVLGTVVEKVKDTAESVLEFEKKIQNTIEPPVMETLNTITALSAGVKTFFDSWKKNKNTKSFEPEFNENPEDLNVSLNDSLIDVNKELGEVNSRLSDLQK